jgi:hypothetical protein
MSTAPRPRGKYVLARSVHRRIEAVGWYDRDRGRHQTLLAVLGAAAEQQRENRRRL